MDKTLGIYVHIPFCASKCSYCDFYSLAGCDRLMPKYQDALVEHIRESYPALKGRYIDTVYFGRRHAGYYGADRLIELFDELKGSGTVLREAEVTLEANPDSAVFRELAKLRREGLQPHIPRRAEREQRHPQAHSAAATTGSRWRTPLSAAREAGFDNLSCDLIYGLPSQTKGDWADTLMRVIELRPEHISCYGLTLEPGTPMHEKYAGSEILPGEDEQADMYPLPPWRPSRTTATGSTRYQTSPSPVTRAATICATGAGRLPRLRRGRAQLHGRRALLLRPDADRYIVGVLRDEDIVDEYSRISSVERGSEYIMLGMRTALGIEAREYTEHYRADFAPIEKTLRVFAEKGWAKCSEDGRWSFTPQGFLLSNLLIGALLEAQSGSRVEVNPWMKPASTPRRRPRSRRATRKFSWSATGKGETFPGERTSCI